MKLLDSNGDRRRLVGVALTALLVGTLIGPGVAFAASTAWVKVKNWPAVQKVLVTNSAAAPVYTQPPAHTIVNLGKGGTIQSAGSSLWTLYYTVPADKWLVITSLRGEGQGASAITAVALTNGSGVHITVPISPYTDNGSVCFSTSAAGPMYVPPGTSLYLSAVRNSSGTGQWNIYVTADGYLTDRP